MCMCAAQVSTNAANSRYDLLQQNTTTGLSSDPLVQLSSSGTNQFGNRKTEPAAASVDNIGGVGGADRISASPFVNPEGEGVPPLFAGDIGSVRVPELGCFGVNRSLTDCCITLPRVGSDTRCSLVANLCACAVVVVAVHRAPFDADDCLWFLVCPRATPFYRF